MNVLSYSYGKDSGACIHVCLDILKWPIDRIVTTDVWATDTIPAVLPEMWEWQCKADEIIKSRYGITVEHVCARNKDGTKKTYEQLFYHIPKRRSQSVQVERERDIYTNGTGFPRKGIDWCRSGLKVSPQNALRNAFRIPGAEASVLQQRTENKGFPGTATTTWCKDLKTKNKAFSSSADGRGAVSNITQFLGIAADEPERIARHINKPGLKLPLVEAGWTEAMCYDWCKANDLLAPTYETSMRGGCWFCHNQGVEQLRLLRKNHPELWEILMRWDLDSPSTFHADGHTVHDFDERFALEDADVIQDVKHWKWAALKMPIGKQIDIFEVMKND